MGRQRKEPIFVYKVGRPYTIEPKADKETGEITGRRIEGVKIGFIDDIDFSHLENGGGEDKTYGIESHSETFPLSILDKLVKVPGVYEGTYRHETAKIKNDFGTKEVQKRVFYDLDFIGEAELKIHKQEAKQEAKQEPKQEAKQQKQ